MAPTQQLSTRVVDGAKHLLSPRYYSSCSSYFGDNDDDNCDRGDWYYWGRWVLLGLVVAAALLFVVSLGCVARRRRRRGTAPMYGTGWMAPQHPSNYGGQSYDMNNQNQYQHQHQQGQGQYGDQGNYSKPPPVYAQQQNSQNTGTTFNPNDGYYGQQPQSPPHVYQQDQNNYGPPSGPPPGK